VAVYLAFALGADSVVVEGSLVGVLAWGKKELSCRSVIKVARARPERSSVTVIADLTSEGVVFARSPRLLSVKESKRLCRKIKRR
jgi:hypothetical protein